MGDHAEAVAQPFDRRAGDEDRSFERVGRAARRAGRPASSAGDARDATASLAGVHQHEAAGAVGRLRPCPARSRPGRTAPPAGRPPCRRSASARRTARRGRAEQLRCCRGLRAAARFGHAEQAAAARRPSAARGCRTATCGWRWWRRSRGPRRRSAATAGSSRSSRRRARRARLARAHRRHCRASRRSWSPRNRGRAAGRCVRRTSGSAPSAFSSAHTSAVRRSCQTIARWIGSPVARSQTTTVSRWLVMPIAATRLGVDRRASASRTTASVSRQICSGSCSTQPRCGIMLRRARAARRRRRARRRRTGWRGSRSCPDRSPRRDRPPHGPTIRRATRQPGRASHLLRAAPNRARHELSTGSKSTPAKMATASASMSTSDGERLEAIPFPTATQQDFSTFFRELARDFGTRVPHVFADAVEHPAPHDPLAAAADRERPSARSWSATAIPPCFKDRRRLLAGRDLQRRARRLPDPPFGRPRALGAEGLRLSRGRGARMGGQGPQRRRFLGAGNGPGRRRILARLHRAAGVERAGDRPCPQRRARPARGSTMARR